MTPAEVLRAAANKLEGGHWIQDKSARSRSGRSVASISPEAVGWCAYGAIDSVSPWAADAIEALRDSIGRSPYVGGEMGGLVGWNDHPGRTEVEVVAMMRATADRLDGAL